MFNGNSTIVRQIRFTNLHIKHPPHLGHASHMFFHKHLDFHGAFWTAHHCLHAPISGIWFWYFELLAYCTRSRDLHTRRKLFFPYLFLVMLWHKIVPWFNQPMENSLLYSSILTMPGPRTNVYCDDWWLSKGGLGSAMGCLLPALEVQGILDNKISKMTACWHHPSLRSYAK